MRTSVPAIDAAHWLKAGLYKTNGLLVAGDSAAQIIGAGIVSLAIAQYLPLAPWLAWWAVVVVSAVAYLLLTRSRLKQDEQLWPLERWFKEFLLYRFCIGLLWALPMASLYFEPASSALYLWVAFSYVLVVLAVSFVNLIRGTLLLSVAPMIMAGLLVAATTGSARVAVLALGLGGFGLLCMQLSYAMRKLVKRYLDIDHQRSKNSQELLEKTEQLGALVQSTAADKERLELLAQNSTDIIAMHAGSGRYLYINDTVTEVLGYQPAEMVGSMPLSYVHVDDQARILEARQSLLPRAGQPRGGKRLFAEFRMRHKQGHYVWLEVFERALPDRKNHSDIHSVTVARDVSQRHAVEVATATQRQILETSLRSIRDAVLTVDANGKVLYANKAAVDIAAHNDWSDALVNDWLPLRVQSGERRFIWKPALGKQKQIVALQAEQRRLFELSSHILSSDLNIPGLAPALAQELLQASPLHQGHVLVLRDITERLALEQQLRRRANTDTLTGVLNRAAFEDKLQAAFQRVQRVGGSHALVFADLDQFKVVNDTAGHAAGDVLIKGIAKALAAAVREGDVVARLGGDEFALLLMDCHANDALRRCQQVCDAVSEVDFEWGGKRFPVGASFGVAMLDKDMETTELAMGRADAACYVVKDRGRRGVHLWAADSLDSGRQATDMNWVSRLQSALKEQRILIFGQQIWSLSGNNSSHVEVLISLREGDGSVSPPSEFIPAAERYGLMPAIDHYVIRAVFKHLAPLQQGLLAANYRVAINLSGHTIGSDKALDDIRKLFHRYAIAPQLICFEITETTALQNIADAQRFLQTLKDMGCQLALDDFGTGFSSFSYLKSLPVDMLKIDGEFVREMLHSETDHSIVESIHNVGRTMGLATVAECVESSDLAKELAAIGVDYGQGVFLSQRLPLKDIISSKLLSAKGPKLG
jgi:Amt family ammonium transporter